MIKFSSKYKPLFNLLKAREEVERLSLLGLGSTDSKKYYEFKDTILNSIVRLPGLEDELLRLRHKGLNKKDSELLNRWLELNAVDTILVSGGRDSSKTFSVGAFTSLGAADYNHRILYTRYTMTSTDNSITSALDNRMQMLTVDNEFTYANHDYLHKSSKGKISITGHKTSSGNQSAKLKSLEDYSMFITDEGEELPNYEDWKKIKLSVRAKDVQCISLISFNPPPKTHWLYKEFYENVPIGFNGVIGNVMYIHTTYLDNGKANIAEHNWNEYERLRLIYESYLATAPEDRLLLPKRLVKDYKQYKDVILGSFRDSAEGVIFDYEIGEFVEPEYGAVYGADHGFTHPTTFIKVYVDKDNKKIYLKETFYKTQQTTTQIYDAVKDEVGFIRVWCDSAVPMFIKDLHNRNLNIRACKKPKIKDSINAILDFELIVDKDSLNLINELNNYRWSDKREDEPVDAFNHCIDAARYAITHILTENIAQIM